MKAEKIVFLYFPCMVLVCESMYSQNCMDRETNDLREYARIRLEDSFEEHFADGNFVFSKKQKGEIIPSKHFYMLSDEQKQRIENVANKIKNEQLCTI